LKKKPSWTPAASFTVTRLKPNGPKPGQTVDAWLHGKTKAFEHLVDDPRNKLNDLPR
jgi:hypothetical protein